MAQKQARVLMVGAGGIGCELLKNLVLMGFGNIHVVDLDTIDLSNLNRQFLFRKEHIKKSKALVAKESAGAFNPKAEIEAYHDNIKDAKFNIAWFSSFKVVFNALDNLDARRHVNKMCLAADVPLVESGTTGFNGQVQVIRKGATECYDCVPKEAPKSFPVCTIRSTPSQPIHCIVWGKSYLFTEIFGSSEDDPPELNYNEESENAEEIEKLRQESRALTRVRESIGSEDFPSLVFNKIFTEDIERLRSMEDMWKTRRAPEALDFVALSKDAPTNGSVIAEQDQIVWTVEQNLAVFVDSVRRLSSRFAELRKKADGSTAELILTFDKDDVDTLDFVAASANLRSYVFGIEPRSKFDIKQMAGNIIPAIATTNAMTAGLCVLQAFKVMRDELNKAKMVFLVRSTERVISSEPLRPPNPTCPVCSVAQGILEVDTSRATLKNLVEDLLRLQLGYGEEFSVQNETGGILFDPEEDTNLGKTFGELGLKADSFITIVDEADDDTKVNLRFSISEKDIEKGTTPIQLPTKPEIATKAKAKASESHDHATTNGTGDGTSDGTASGLAIGKRKRDGSDAGLVQASVSKRGKVGTQPSDDIIVLDDGDGSILIDD